MNWRSQYYRFYSKFNAAAIANSSIGRSILWAGSLSGAVLFKIGRFESKPWFVRTSMRTVRHILPIAKVRNPDKFPFPGDVQKLSDLRIATIVDDFSFLSFNPECNLLSLKTDDWKEKLEEFRPNLLLVESAWLGKEESWKWKVSVLSPELIQIIAWCKQNHVPTVFWNKEDPKHFETFIRVAEFFDVVFTTDLDMIPQYRQRLGHERVHLLPFATQPMQHNPIEKFERSMGFCFAGSYYTQQIERNKAFARFVNIVSKYGELQIFDRYMNTDDVRMSFPERYRRFIVDKLPPENIDRAYNGYMFGINMNSIKNSQSMFARRVFELISSNTVTVGNYSRGVHNFLGELTLSTDDTVWLKARLNKLTRDVDARDKFRLAGLRAVMSQHTYGHRLSTIVERTFDRGLHVDLPEIMVLSAPRNPEELERVRTAFERQSYSRKSLMLFGDLGGSGTSRTADKGVLTKFIQESGQTYVALFNPNDYYGTNYLLDLATTVVWSRADSVGKKAMYAGSGKVVQERDWEYRFVDRLDWRSAIIRCGLIDVEDALKALETGERSLEPPVCLSVDRFNYCRDWDGGETGQYDDAPLLDLGMRTEIIDEVLARSGGRPVGFIARSDTVIICGMFPQPFNPGRYGYLLDIPRMARWRRSLVDVVRINRAGEDRYYDICGIDVCHISEDTLSSVLASGQHSKIEIHLFDESMLGAISNIAEDKELTIWAYGPELPISNALRTEASPLTHRDNVGAVKMWKNILSSERIKVKFASSYIASKAIGSIDGFKWDERRHSLFTVNLDTQTYSVGKSTKNPLRIMCPKPYLGSEIDIDLLVKIIDRFKADPVLNDATLTIQGDWSGEWERLMPHIDGRKVLHKMENTGPKEKVDSMRAFGIVILPLSEECNGASVREAMACGVVPVISDIGAVREFVDDSCGFIVQNEEMAFIKALRSLIADKSLFRGMSSKASICAQDINLKSYGDHRL